MKDNINDYIVKHKLIKGTVKAIGGLLVSGCLFAGGALGVKNQAKKIQNIEADFANSSEEFINYIQSEKTKAKTVGKMIDQYLTIEGCFDIVLLACAEGQEHYFLTQSDGYTTAKSPEGMFELKIPNDLKAVDTAIRKYYEFNEENENEKD